MDKGAIPYGEHEPWPYHENNGKNSMTAVLFALQGNRIKEAQFFAKMATAGYQNRECGHTGQGFSYLWGALGANAGGPAAAAAFFKEASWHLDLVRRCDGSFTYDGGEQYGPGKTDDNTYYGNSSYYGLSPTATYVLTYSLPLKKLCITGKDANQANWLEQTGCGGRHRLRPFRSGPQEPRPRRNSWRRSAIGRPSCAAGRRRNWPSVPRPRRWCPNCIAMAEGTDVHVAQGAVETLGDTQERRRRCRCWSACFPTKTAGCASRRRRRSRRWAATPSPRFPTFSRRSPKPPNRCNRSTGPIPSSSPMASLAAALFAGGLTDCAQGCRSQLRLSGDPGRSPATPDGMARATLRGYFENKLTVEDVAGIGAGYLVTAVKTLCPADTMFGNEIRMGAFKALTKYHFKEAIDAGVIFAKTQGGHGSESRTGEIMKEIVRLWHGRPRGDPGTERGDRRLQRSMQARRISRGRTQ